MMQVHQNIEKEGTVRQSRKEGGATMEGRLRGPAGVWLAAIAAAMLIVAGLFAAPARAQTAEDIVVDFSVDVVQGECGEEGCPEGERPVTFEPELVVDRDASRADLDTDQIAEVDRILEEQAEVEVEIEGEEEPVETGGEPICLEPGEYDFTAEVVNEEALATAIAEEIGDNTFDADDLVIEPVEDTFVVEECDDNDDDNGNVDIDDRDQTNVCRNVVNIILNDVQNPDVNNNQDADVDTPITREVEEEPEPDDVIDEPVGVTDEQVVDIAQELNVSPTIVQQCIQQNAGRDANLRIGDEENIDVVIVDEEDIDEKIIDEENIDEKIVDEEEDVFVDKEVVDDDGEAVVLDEQRRGEVLAATIPDGLLPNTGGISPAAVLAGLGFALLLAGLSVGHAVARRRS